MYSVMFCFHDQSVMLFIPDSILEFMAISIFLIYVCEVQTNLIGQPFGLSMSAYLKIPEIFSFYPALSPSMLSAEFCCYNYMLYMLYK